MSPLTWLRNRLDLTPDEHPGAQDDADTTRWLHQLGQRTTTGRHVARVSLAAARARRWLHAAITTTKES